MLIQTSSDKFDTICLFRVLPYFVGCLIVISGIELRNHLQYCNQGISKALPDQNIIQWKSREIYSDSELNHDIDCMFFQRRRPGLYCQLFRVKIWERMTPYSSEPERVVLFDDSMLSVISSRETILVLKLMGIQTCHTQRSA